VKRILISLLVTAAIIIFLFTQISLADLFRLVVTIDPLWALLGGLCYLISAFLRALRFKWLIHSKEVPLLQLFRISILYNLFLMSLPSRLGELSYPYLLRRSCGISMTEGMASLIASRIYDLLVTLMIFLVAATKFQGIFKMDPLGLIFLALVLTALTLLALFHMNYLLAWVSNGVFRISTWVGPKGSGLLHWVQKRIAEMSEDFSAIKARGTHLWVTVATIICWIMAFWMFYAFLMGFGIFVPFPKVVFGSTIAILANALPISGLGNWGVLEAGWAVGFLLVGLSKEEAIATGFGVHILIFLITGLIGLPCWLTLKQRSPSPPAP
jgi:uncharacterized protein (TIRG00374 family)